MKKVKLGFCKVCDTPIPPTGKPGGGYRVCDQCYENRMKRYSERRRQELKGDTYLYRRLMQNFLNYSGKRCAYCGYDFANPDKWGAQGRHLPIPEHVVSIGIDSDDVPSPHMNIVCSCFGCNASKNDKELSEWIVWKFGEERAHEALARIAVYFDRLEILNKF